MAAVMTVGCGSASEDEVLPLPQQPGSESPITISGNLSEEGTVTRATGLETYYKNFKVWAFKNLTGTATQIVMDEYNVNWVANTAHTSTSNTNDWEYVNQQDLGGTEQSIKYWDFSALAYRFFGVAGSTETNVPTGKYVYEPGTSDPTAYEVTYKSDAENESTIPYYSRLSYVESDGYGKPVQLEFIKPLSKVRFIFIFEEPDKAAETELTNPDFRPTNGNTIKMKGKVKITYNLTGTTNRESFSADAEAEGITALTKDYYTSVSTTTMNPDTENEQEVVTSPYLNADSSESALGKVYTVLPTPNGQGSYTMTVKVNGDPKTAVVPADFMVWQPGYLYTYIFKIHVDGSVTIDNVQSAFTQWQYHSLIEDHVVYNW